METSVGACRQQMPPATFVPDPNGNYCPMAAGHKRHGPGGTGETHRKPLRGGRARVQSRLLHSFLVTGADGPRLQAGPSPRGTMRIYARPGPIRRNNGFPIGAPGAAPFSTGKILPARPEKIAPMDRATTAYRSPSKNLLWNLKGLPVFWKLAHRLQPSLRILCDQKFANRT